MSKSTIPADNGRYRDGTGTLHEGGTCVTLPNEVQALEKQP
jgi:hypothetical protein